MNDNMFFTDYKKSVESVKLPDDYKFRILSNLKETILQQEMEDTQNKSPYAEKIISISEKSKSDKSKSGTKLKFVLSLVASILALVVGASVLFGIMPAKKDVRLVTINVASATNLSVVQGARIVFKNSDGDLIVDDDGEVVDAITNEEGTATAEIPDEEGLIAEVAVDGYISTQQSVDNENIYISPVMDENTYRAVLTWEKKCDLDAHLSITTDKGVTKLHYFNSDAQNSDGEVIAALDVDNETGDGPETITFNAQKNLLMRFSVASYSSLADDSVILSKTGATVTLYRGNTCVGVYNINTGAQGNVWCVFEVEDNELNVRDYTYSVSAITEVK